MKTNYLIPVILAFFALTSCSNDEDNTATPRASGTIGGNITTNTTYAKGDYTLDGALVVKNGATLTIAAGSLITAKSDDSDTDYIMVENGGKIMAEGTAAEPIVMTSLGKSRGDWAGIVIFGDAPIVTTSAATTGTAEIGGAISYGGSNATHNSGSLKYVQVLYAGDKIGDGTQEFNGFSFYAVGSGTILDHLVSAYGNDDGFEWYGGTVSATNLISYGNSDDSFDWEGGWRGQNNANWFAYQTGTGNFGMEIEANNNNNAFWPVIDNITLKRALGTVTEGGSSASEFDAIQFKKNGNGEFDNVKISGYTGIGYTGVRIQDTGTNDNQVTGNKIILTNMNITATTNFAGAGVIVPVFPSGKFTTNGSAVGAAFTAGNWAVIESTNALSQL
jgi:hypothetical protein